MELQKLAVLAKLGLFGGRDVKAGHMSVIFGIEYAVTAWGSWGQG